MRILTVMLMSLAALGQQPRPATLTPFVIIAHAGYNYTVRHGHVLMKVTYRESQTSTYKQGDAIESLVTGLHYHQLQGVYPHGPDLSQVPEVGLSIRQCVLSQTLDSDGDPVIAIQPTPDPCMTQNGDTLHFTLAPNGPVLFTYVNFDIVSERLEGSATPLAATHKH